MMDSNSAPAFVNAQFPDLLRAALHADLDFHGANGKYSTHGWHPFPARFPPQLPQFFIENLSARDETVLDPMFGSGATLVEAARLGRRVVGCDIDPLALMIAEAKLTPLEPAQALDAGCRIIEAAQHAFYHERERLELALKQRFDTKTKEFIDYWFLPQQQLELLALLQGIEAMPRTEMQKFFKMIFSATIIAKSGGVSLARDLAHTRPHRVSSKKPASAFLEFGKRLKSSLASYTKYTEELSDLKWQEKQEIELRAAHADKTGIAPSSVDLIVTSPPYANNAIDYMRAHKFSLVWFGWKIAELAKIRARYLGHDAVKGARFEVLPRQCENTLVRLAKLDTKKTAALRRYFSEMSSVIKEMKRVLKNGRAAIIVVGTSNLCGMDVETHNGLAAIGESVGFDLAGVGVRRLDRDKRMMPARWNKNQHSQIENRMHEEYVLGLIKQ